MKYVASVTFYFSKDQGLPMSKRRLHPIRATFDNPTDAHGWLMGAISTVSHSDNLTYISGSSRISKEE